MPWTAKSASEKTSKANTLAKKKRWAAVANSALKGSGNDGRAIREANLVIAKMADGGLAARYSGGSDEGYVSDRGMPYGRHRLDLTVPVDNSSSLTGRVGASPSLYGPGKNDVEAKVGYMKRFASGGLASLNSIPYAERQFQKGAKSGFIHSLVPGRTDRLPMSVKANSFVVPADVVSTLGQGNSVAGGHILSGITKGPYGASIPTGRGKANFPKPPKPANLARGGKSDNVEIVAAGGEHILTPEEVERIGGGDLKEGHRILNAMVLKVRKHGAKKMLSLKPPKK